MSYYFWNNLMNQLSTNMRLANLLELSSSMGLLLISESFKYFKKYQVMMPKFWIVAVSKIIELIQIFTMIIIFE